MAQENQFNPNKEFHSDSLRQLTKDLMTGISKKHPGFYRYTSKDYFDHLVDSTIQTINNSLTELEFYRKIKPLFAQIGCLHTGVSLSNDYQEYLDKTHTLVPVEIFVDASRKVFVTKVYGTTNNLKVGDEILDIIKEELEKSQNYNNLYGEYENQAFEKELVSRSFSTFRNKSTFNLAGR